MALLAALVVLRVSNLLSELDLLYDDEFTIMGRLALHVADGTFQWEGLKALVGEYQYGSFAPGTVVTQLTTLALSMFMGANGWALIASSILFELVLLLAWLWTAERLGLSPLAAALTTGPLFFAPWFAVTWQLLPFGNHSEYLWVPLLLLGLLAAPMDRRGAIVAAVVVVLGVFLYRLNVASVVGLLFAGALAASPVARKRGLIAVVVGVLGVLLLLGGDWALGFDYRMAGFDGGGLLRLPRTMWDHVPQLAQRNWGEGFGHSAAPRGWRTIHKIALFALPILALRAWRRPELRPALGFVLGWSITAFAVPAAFGESPDRYYLPGWYALVACGLVAWAAWEGRGRRVIAGALLLLTLGGMQETWRHHRPERWVANAQIDALALGQRLGVWYLERDDAPYYARILEEGRAHRSIGLMPPDPELLERRTHTYPSEPVAQFVRAQRERMVRDGVDPRTAFHAAGRGAWITGERDLPALEAWWRAEGVAPPELTWLLAGARAEAALGRVTGE